jgi:hypothetical protein
VVGLTGRRETYAEWGKEEEGLWMLGMREEGEEKERKRRDYECWE